MEQRCQSLAVMKTMHRLRDSGYWDLDLFVHVLRDDIVCY